MILLSFVGTPIQNSELVTLAISSYVDETSTEKTDDARKLIRSFSGGGDFTQTMRDLRVLAFKENVNVRFVLPTLDDPAADIILPVLGYEKDSQFDPLYDSEKLATVDVNLIAEDGEALDIQEHADGNLEFARQLPNDDFKISLIH